MDAARELARRKRPTTLVDLINLRGSIDAHVTLAAAAAATRDFVDVRSARRLADRLHALLDDAATLDADGRSTLAAAIDYFVDTADAEDDLMSPLGFDDDTDIVDAAERMLPLTPVPIAADLRSQFETQAL